MMSLVQASQLLEGSLHGEDASFNSVSTDTRSLQPGSLYFALVGDRFDGHDFISKAQSAGAVGAVVSDIKNINLPQIEVVDTRKALGRLAAAWRQQFNGLVVGITGSNGKTTVKEMVAAILAEQGDVLATRGNFNNDIGLPLTLLRMAKENFAVIEMGANHHGEIDYLTHITKPDVALITNAGPAHLEGFGSIRGVAEAKGEIYGGLVSSGVAIVNGDDDYADYWLTLCEGKKVIRFALENVAAEIKGEWLPNEKGGVLRVSVPDDRFNINLPLPGKHNAMNALASIAVGIAANVDVNKIKSALENFKAVKGRLNIIKTTQGITLIDDTYNANPASLFAGLEVLKAMQGEHWLVLGDMGELGDDVEKIHTDVGRQCKQVNIDHLLAVGASSRFAVDAFGDQGMHFNNKEELIRFIKGSVHKNVNILIKGSRFMAMEEVVESLAGKQS